MPRSSSSYPAGAPVVMQREPTVVDGNNLGHGLVAVWSAFDGQLPVDPKLWEGTTAASDPAT